VTMTRSSLLLELGNAQAEDAWKEFLEIYRPLIDRTIRRSGISAHDHEDAVQEVLIQLLRVLPTFSYQKEKGFFRHWLRRVTMNKAIDFRRRRSNWPNATDQLDTVMMAEDHSHWVREFQRGLVQSAMTCIESEFRPRTWNCFLLHLWERRSAQETAMRSGVSVNAVYVNCSRVLARLREFCEFHGEDFDAESLSRFESVDPESRRSGGESDRTL